jgi:hypothetical protein
MVENPDGVGSGIACIEMDGNTLPSGDVSIVLADDGRTHRVRVILGVPREIAPI